MLCCFTCRFLHYCSYMKLCCIAGIPILTVAITTPSCSSQPCWLATSRSHPTRRSMWEWHMSWGSPPPTITTLPKRTNSTRCLPGTHHHTGSHRAFRKGHSGSQLLIWRNLVIIICVFWPSSLSLQEYVSLRGVILSGGAVTAALQAGEGEHTSTLRCTTEQLCFQLPASAGLWWQRVGR